MAKPTEDISVKVVSNTEGGTFASFKRKREAETAASGSGEFAGADQRREFKPHSTVRSPCKDYSNNEHPNQSKRTKLFDNMASNTTDGNPVPVATSCWSLHASSLNTSAYPKLIHVDQQHRYIVVSRISKICTRGTAVITFKIKSEKDGSEKTLVLKDLWAQLDWMTEGVLINIIDAQVENDKFTVERLQGFVVVEPDTLVSATNIIGQMYCERKAALARMNYGGDNILMFRGVVAHELICRAMVQKIKDLDELKKAVRLICRRPQMLEKAYACGLTDADLEALQNEVFPWVARFINQRFLTSPNPDPKYQNFRFRKVVGVEDNVWNPSFGLKGKIDATVMIEKDSQRMVVPLEFKTGSTKQMKRQMLKADHMGQVALYTLMMSIKYGTVEDAILYYISDDSLTLHPTKRFELQHLIANRNKHVRHSTLVNGELPYLPRPDADYEFKCKTCEMRSVCTLNLRKKNIDPTSASQTEKRLLESFKLNETEVKFFEDWLHVINSETEEVEKKYTDKYLWTKSPSEREKIGTCVTNLKMFGECTPFNDGYLVSLVKSDASQLTTSQQELCFKVDDFVALSSNVEVCINYGVIVAIKQNQITLSLDQKLHEEYSKTDFTFSVDKISSTSPIASQYGYLLKLMEENEFASRLRSYVIHKKQPSFGKMTVPDPDVSKIITDLNAEQARVIFKSLTTDSFLFVKGIPGSGKTTTIVGLLRTLVHLGNTVLVVSYTGSALENIMLKYKRYGQNFVKISTSGRVDAELGEFTTKCISANAKGVDQLAEAYNRAPLIATTLLSLRHPIFQKRWFDYCVIDEASQALPTAVFGALSLARKYVVFGDPNQLPPVVQSSALKKKNMSDNFFSLMATPVSTIKLNTQYRMNKTITKLANELVYENQMKCGSEAQERSRIKLTEEDLRTFLTYKVASIPARKLLCKAVSKKLERAVVFLDTSNISAFESRVEETIANEGERYITIGCVRLFIECFLSPSKLGIIAPYRGQVNLIRSSLKKMEFDALHNIEVNTVDQYQGREMEVVFCSFTKSLSSDSPFFNEDGKKENKDNEKVNIMEDLRRLNVAITRARRKLVLIGNKQTLIKFSPFQKLFSILTPEQICPVSEEAFQGLKELVQAGLAKKNTAT